MNIALKIRRADTPLSHGDVAIAVLGVAMICALLWNIALVLQGQMSKAEQRDALRHAQRQEIARCWQETSSPLAMRGCMAEARLRTARALDASYGLPVPRADELPHVSVVSLSY